MADSVLTDGQIQRLECQLMKVVFLEEPIRDDLLRTKLAWDERTYWHIRNRLVGSGFLIGTNELDDGGLSLSPDAHLVVKGDTSSNVMPRLTEKHLYDPIVDIIRRHWVVGRKEFILDCTARQGSRDTGGKWTRPDIILAIRKTHRFVPGTRVELSTFEIKTSRGLDVTAIYEALAHRRAAHYSYVLVWIPEAERPELDSVLKQLRGHATEQGVGLIFFDTVSDYTTWTFEVEPRRNDPDPELIDNFIHVQASESFKDTILSWCRSL